MSSSKRTESLNETAIARAGFRFSRATFVESLESGELKTGRKIALMTEALNREYRLGVSVDFVECEDVLAFEKAIVNLIEEARSTGLIPLLHVECHGHKEYGLEFANGSQLSWTNLSRLLLELNEATRFNLVAVFSACYGAHFLGQLGCIDASPCYAMIAPSESIYPDEILKGFGCFYETLFRTSDAGLAVKAMLELPLVEGTWFAKQAELWFEEVVIGYVTHHCSNAENKKRALRMYKTLRSEGIAADLGTLRRGLIKANRDDLIGKYFNRFFVTQQIPENANRFGSLRARIKRRLDELRGSGHYAI